MNSTTSKTFQEPKVNPISLWSYHDRRLKPSFPAFPPPMIQQNPERSKKQGTHKNGSERFRLLYVVLHAPLESSHLMEVMVGHNSYCCGEVQASDVSPDGDGITGICLPYVGWKATGLRAEEQVFRAGKGRHEDGGVSTMRCPKHIIMY